MSAPSAAATSVPITAATPKFSWPCVAMNGMLMPQSLLTAQPAMKPPAVTNDACARLTIPPRPVTTTNERNTMAKAMPGASTPNASNSSAWAQAQGNHWSVNATSRKMKIAHGRSRRQRGRPSR